MLGQVRLVFLPVINPRQTDFKKHQQMLLGLGCVLQAGVLTMKLAAFFLGHRTMNTY